jgi:hypothetical protein
MSLSEYFDPFHVHKNKKTPSLSEEVDPFKSDVVDPLRKLKKLTDY